MPLTMAAQGQILHADLFRTTHDHYVTDKGVAEYGLLQCMLLRSDSCKTATMPHVIRRTMHTVFEHNAEQQPEVQLSRQPPLRTDSVVRQLAITPNSPDSPLNPRIGPKLTAK